MTDFTNQSDPTEIDLYALETSLGREANLRIAANAKDEAKPKAFLMCDFEYLFRREMHDAWTYGRAPERDARGQTKVPRIKWPFQSIAAASWMVVRIDAQGSVITIEPPVVMTLGEYREVEILKAFFAALDALGETGRMITWGGEVRDLAALRFQACRHGLKLPLHLRDTSPYARERIDLCRATTVQADPVHLDEYAAGAGIPAKPSPPTAIGRLAEEKKWDAVHDHVLADVLTTSIIALRWLSAMGEIACDRERSADAIAEAGLAAFPESPFLKRDFKPWARDQLRSTGLSGTVYRIEEVA
jgi:hypothetical protein